MGICIPVQQGEEQIDRQFAAVIIENDVGLGPCIGAGMSDYQYTYTRRCRSFDLRESSCPCNLPREHVHLRNLPGRTD